jgi:hypothetical protein
MDRGCKGRICARDRSMFLDRQTRLELLLWVIGTIVLVAFAAFFLVDR